MVEHRHWYSGGFGKVLRWQTLTIELSPNRKRSAPGPLSRAVSAILERERVDQGLSQMTLAAKCGVSQSQLSKLLRGERVFLIDVLDDVCAALGMSLAEVVREADSNR